MHRQLLAIRSPSVLPEEGEDAAAFADHVVEFEAGTLFDGAVGGGGGEWGEAEVTGHQFQAEEMEAVADDEDAFDAAFVEEAIDSFHAFPG